MTELAAPPTHRTATSALEELGLTGDRLLKLARRIATDAQRRAPAGLGGKYEDLVSFLVLQALQAAITYDPDYVRPGYNPASYLCDVMERRVTDWYRRKSEGFGDSRSGSNGRVVFHEDIDEQGDYELTLPESTIELDQHWSSAAGALSTPMHDWALLSEAVVMDWIRASHACGVPFTVWVRRSLDLASRHQLRQQDAA
jgi:DNA-directed RNA polymerase specialized sigma24 family protein